jgi:hypothetical protein
MRVEFEPCAAANGARLPSATCSFGFPNSSTGLGQEPKNQLRQLREWGRYAGHLIVREYVEHENGGKGIEYRKQLGAMFPYSTVKKYARLMGYEPLRAGGGKNRNG